MDFTARNVAKYVVKAAVHTVVSKHTETLIIDHTRFEEDDFVVDSTSFIVGWGVSEKLKPYTDKAVDKTADFIATKREARKAKKETTSEEQ